MERLWNICVRMRRSWNWILVKIMRLWSHCMLEIVPMWKISREGSRRPTLRAEGKKTENKSEAKLVSASSLSRIQLIDIWLFTTTWPLMNHPIYPFKFTISVLFHTFISLIWYSFLKLELIIILYNRKWHYLSLCIPKNEWSNGWIEPLDVNPNLPLLIL